MANYQKAVGVGQYILPPFSNNLTYEINHHVRQKAQVASTGDISHHQPIVYTDAQVARPHANEILTINNTGHTGNNHPFGSQVIELAESQMLSNTIQLSPSISTLKSHNYSGSQEITLGYRPFDDILIAPNHQYLSQNIVTRPANKKPFLNGLIPTANIVSGLMRSPSVKKEQPLMQQLPRSISGYISNTSNNSRIQSPLIIGSKAFDALIHPNHVQTYRNRSSSNDGRQQVRSIDKTANNNGQFFTNRNLPPNPNQSYQNAKNVALPKEMRRPPLPQRPKAQKLLTQQIRDESKRLNTQPIFQQDAQITQVDHYTIQNNPNMIPSASLTALPQSPNRETIKQFISTNKSANKSYLQKTIEEAKSPQEIQTASPTPMDRMKVSVQSIKQPVTAFSFSRPEDLASKLTPVNSLFNLHTNKVHGSKDYMSQGLNYFSTGKLMPYTDSIINSNQNLLNTSNKSSVNGSATSFITGYFGSNSLNGSINNIPFTTPTNEAGIYAAQHFQSPQTPKSLIDQPINLRPENFEHPLAVDMNIKLQNGTQSNEKQTQQRRKADINSMMPFRTVQPVTSPASQSANISDALKCLSFPIIQVIEYKPEKGVQFPDEGEYFEPMAYIRKDLVDRSVQWQSRVGCPDEIVSETLQFNRYPENQFKHLVQQDMYETNQIIERRQHKNQSFQVELIETEYALRRQGNEAVKVHNTQETQIKIQTIQDPTLKPLVHKNSLLEAGLKLIYGQEGTKKYQEFLQKMEERDNSIHHQSAIVPVSPTAANKHPSPHQLITTTTVHKDTYLQMQKIFKKDSYKAQKQSEPRTVGKFDDKYEEVFDKYAKNHSNRYIHEYPSWKDLPESNSQQAESIYIKALDQTDGSLDYLKTKYGTRKDQTISRYDKHYEYIGKTTNEDINKMVFNYDNEKAYKNEISSAKTINQHVYPNNLISVKTLDSNTKLQFTQSRGKSKTLLTNVPKMLSYEDLRMKLQRDESELLKGYRQNY